MSSSWFLAAMIMLALPEVTRINSHIVISFFLEKMKPGSRQHLGWVIAHCRVRHVHDDRLDMPTGDLASI